MTDRALALLVRVASLLLAVAVLLTGGAAAQSISPATAAKTPTAASAAPTATTGTPKPRRVLPTTTRPTATRPATTTVAPKPAAATKKPAKKPAAKKPAAKKPVLKLSGSLGGGSAFPERSVVLSVPPNFPLSASQVHVTENGRTVTRLALTPMSRPNAGDLGVVLVIDQSTNTTGAPLAYEMAAGRSLAAQRGGNEQVGVVTFDAAPSVGLPLTSAANTIKSEFNTTPWTGSGTQVLPGLALALNQLAQANIAVGAVILISDGADQPTGSLTPHTIAVAAQARHVRIYTVGVRDSHYSSSSMRRLAQVAGGQFSLVNTAQLGNAVTKIQSELSHLYLVRYRSAIAPGRPVSVSAHVDGIANNLNMSYTAPLPIPAPHPAAHQRVASAASHYVINPDPLSPSPSFAIGSRVPQHSFWDSSVSLLIVAGGCALLIGLAVALLSMGRPAKRMVQTRVASFIADSETSVDPASGSTRDTDVPGVLARRPWWPRFVENVAVARFKHTPVQLVKRALWGSVAAAVLITFVAGSVIFGVLGLALGPLLLRFLVKRGARRQRFKFSEQLPSHLQDISGAMRAGRSFIGAIASVAESGEQPMRGELERALADERLGRPLEESLEAIGERMQSDDMEQVALVAGLHRRSGSNVADSMDRVAEGARERADLRREMKALTAQAKITSYVLTALPVVLLVAMIVITPNYSQPIFGTTLGIIVMCVCATMVFAGWMVMNKITNVEA